MKKTACRVVLWALLLGVPVWSVLWAEMKATQSFPVAQTYQCPSNNAGTTAFQVFAATAGRMSVQIWVDTETVRIGEGSNASGVTLNSGNSFKLSSGSYWTEFYPGNYIGAFGCQGLLSGSSPTITALQRLQ